ncbi:DUF3597 domain-containing protein [Limoniibacter endophyticus]|uniref:DUF3597 domain-containing protein n=1 Tax=Limoniibacter endophyticus TaxID=1565040 RepID=A0A8J3DPT4_9HYPH|nr:DUF3597 domain-containing protein [Limoniibacter endophyticus]GHC64726.1 hypothetical protein GCM10010136_06880 [Limoniibacter endophyticus]
MGIFDRIKGAIFGKAHAAPAPAEAGTSAAGTTTAAPAPSSAPSAAPTSAPSAAPAGAPVDVEAILDAAVKAKGQKLNWRESIVDLMKALGMESSLAERKELADELGYTGDKSDSATMNIWLHKQLLKKLSENGGKVPANLLD